MSQSKREKDVTVQLTGGFCACFLKRRWAKPAKQHQVERQSIKSFSWYWHSACYCNWKYYYNNSNTVFANTSSKEPFCSVITEQLGLKSANKNVWRVLFFAHYILMRRRWLCWSLCIVYWIFWGGFPCFHPFWRQCSVIIRLFCSVAGLLSATI